MMRELTQVCGGSASPVVVGSGLASVAAARCLSLCGGTAPTSVLLIFDGAVARSAVEPLVQAFAAAQPKLAVHRMQVEASERAKVGEEWLRLQRDAVAAGVDRGALVIAVGGGVVTDIGGFVAASLLRGIEWAAMPTTLLGMVDAALGGKTGINVRLGDGRLAKNMCGAFWPPRLVVSDVSLLSTLPVRELRSGLAECLKHALLADGSLAACLLASVTDARDMGAAAQSRLVDLVARSAQVKLDIVESDPREDGRRMLLNLGHTFGHAIEGLVPDEMLHGEAVAIGLVAAAAAAVEAGLMALGEADAVRDMVEGLGLPARLPSPLGVDLLLRVAGSDKKRRGGAWTLILPRGGGGAEVVRGADERLLRVGFAAVGAE
jgi:3-dehydroquinate synthetase